MVELAAVRAEMACTTAALKARCVEGVTRAERAEERVRPTQGAPFEAQGQLMAVQEGAAAAAEAGPGPAGEAGEGQADEGWLSNYLREKGQIFNLENGKLVYLDKKKCKQRVDAGYVIDLVRMTISRPIGVSKVTTDAE